MRGENGNRTYPPINVLKAIAENVWIVDGPLIRFGPPLLKMPFPTRMTIIRLNQHDLFVHSPTPLMPELAADIAGIGTPRWIIAPNRLHYWWIPDWKVAFPGADAFLAPRVEEQAGSRIDFPFLRLDRDGGYPWDDEITTIAVAGSYMTEIDFFHRKSRTLVLADLIEDFEPSKLSLPMRFLARLGGCLFPDGGMPRDLRLTFRRDKAKLRKAVETMIGWNPERIILAHGRWYETGGVDELKRAFRWLLR
jgi:hypothetical protein